MIINELKFDFLNEFNKKNSSCKETFHDPILTIRNSPVMFLQQLENQNISVREIDKEVLLKLFYYACNMLKEIERNDKILGLKILEHIVDFIPQELFLNAYIFERIAARSFSSSARKKFVSVGDYELTKYDSDLGVNYGFFATSLEEEKKEIKIQTLNLISRVGSNENNKEFAIKSFKYTIELVNDEEDDVRITTIKCLESLIANFKPIDLKSCEIIFFNIKEKSSNLRKLLYSLISKFHFETEDEFTQCIKSLYENLKLFPEDKTLLFECLKKMSRNNSVFIDNEYIEKLFGLDSNYLMQELNWNDLEYNSNLIIFQEYLKSKDYKVQIALPKFFIKHFNYLSDRYPHIYEKEVYNFLSKINTYKSSLVSDNKSQEAQEEGALDLSYKNNLYAELENDFSRILNYFQKFKNNANYTEIYKFTFSFLNFILKENEENFEYAKSFIITNKIISLLGTINFKLSLENNPDSDSNNNDDNVDNDVDNNPFLNANKIIQLNNFITGFINTNISTKLNLQLMNTHNLKTNHFNNAIDFLYLVPDFREFVHIINNKNNSQVVSTFLQNFLLYLNQNFPSIMSSSLIDVKITNPKHNFNYIHVKNRAGIIFPFFIQINIKLKNISITPNSNNEIFLAKNLIILITKFNISKKVDLDPSNIKINRQDSSVSIKSKCPIYITDNESGEYSISVNLKSFVKRDFKEILSSLNFNTVTSLKGISNTEFISLNEDIHFIITY